MSDSPTVDTADIARLRTSYRITRLLAAVVIAGCVLMTLVMASGAWLALSLSEWGTLTLALLGMGLMIALAAFTVYLTRRQARILSAGEALLQRGRPHDGAAPQ